MRRWKIQVNLVRTSKGSERTGVIAFPRSAWPAVCLAVEEINASVVFRRCRIRTSVHQPVVKPLPSEFQVLVGNRNLKPLTQEADIVPVGVV